MGPSQPVSTTLKPLTTSTPQLEEDAIQVFVVAVNEIEFYREQFEKFYGEIEAFSDDKGDCKMVRSRVKSCALTCAMTQDPDRGCLTFSVGVKKSNLCQYDTQKLRSDMTEK